MPERLIYDNVLCLDMALKAGTKAIVLDFRKAYDSLAHKALIIILNWVGLPAQFVNMVRSMLHGSTARILVNDCLSTSFNVCSGVKQGDPLSPLLFTFAVELLARSPNAKADHIPSFLGFMLAILMYADDTVLLTKTIQGIEDWMNTLEELRKATGLTINIDKTFLVNAPDTGDIRQMIDVFRYLGFNFNSNGLINDYESETIKAKELLSKWKRPKWNMMTKISVLRTYIESILVFKGFVFGKTYKSLDKARKDFLWNGKTLVSHERMYQSISSGGLGLTRDSIRMNSLKTRLAERIIFDTDMKIHQIIKDAIDKEDLHDAVMNKKEISTPTKTLDHLLKTWSLNTPNADKEHTVQEIQDFLKHKRKEKIITTRRQRRYQYRNPGIRVTKIFLNIRRIRNLEIRQFMWLFFQGGLPFFHNGTCTYCNGTLSHRHIFFTCKNTKTYWRQADRMFNVIYNYTASQKKIKAKIYPLWSENSIWAEWSDMYPVSKTIREIAAVTMYTIWRNYKMNTKIVDMLELLVNDELVVAKCIRNKEERKETIRKIHKRWKTSKLWYDDGVSITLRTDFRHYIRKGEKSRKGNKLLNNLETQKQTEIRIFHKYQPFDTTNNDFIPLNC